MNYEVYDDVRQIVFNPPERSPEIRQLIDELAAEFDRRRVREDMAPLQHQDPGAWRAGYGMAHWYFEGDMPEHVLHEGMRRENIVDLGWSFCLAAFVPMLRDRGEPESTERFGIFVLAFSWALDHLLSEQMSRHPESRQKKAPVDPEWAI